MFGKGTGVASSQSTPAILTKNVHRGDTLAIFCANLVCWEKHSLYSVSFSAGKPAAKATRGGLVGSSGLEPPTSRLSGVRSNHLSYEPMSRLLIGFPSLLAAFCACPCPTFGPTRVLLSPLRYAFTREESAFGTGGDEEARTPDPLRARQMLSHLSYTPVHKKALLRPCFPFLTVSFC